MNVLNVIQHTSADYLGLLEDHLEGRRIRFRYFRPFTEQGAIPGPGDVCDGLILLGGGPWGSAGGRNVPTLQAEIARASIQRVAVLCRQRTDAALGLVADQRTVVESPRCRCPRDTREIRELLQIPYVSELVVCHRPSQAPVSGADFATYA